MMAPFVYEKARANAALHIQLRRCRIAPQPADATSVCVTGWVLRIFRNRGDHSIRTEDKFFCTNYNSVGSLRPCWTAQFVTPGIASVRRAIGGVPRVLG